MKYAKTFDTIEDYHAEEDTFEYPHLSYILSGDTVIIDLDEEDEEEPATDLTTPTNEFVGFLGHARSNLPR